MSRLRHAFEDTGELLGIKSPPFLRARQAAEISAANTKLKLLRENCQTSIIKAARAGHYRAQVTIADETPSEAIDICLEELRSVGYQVAYRGSEIWIVWEQPGA